MAATMKEIRFGGKAEANLTRLKVTNGSKIAKGMILALLEPMYKVKSDTVGTITQIQAKVGDVISPGQSLFVIESCDHPVVMKDMCAECGEDLRQLNGLPGDRKEQASASVAMVHSIPELVVSEKEALDIGHEDEVRLLTNKKLVLLVDLDQTLIHTTNDNIPANLKDVLHFQLWHANQKLWYHTKFRPGTTKFLQEISKLYELHICTFGARMYAHTIAGLMDPEGKYFSHRILSRDECFSAHSKTANLRALFPCGDGMVCIIDDRDDVWNYAPNLLHVKPYRFFKGTADINAPPGLLKTEENTEKTVEPLGEQHHNMEEDTVEGETVAGEPPAEGKPVAGEPPAEGEPVAGEPPAEGKPIAGEPPADGEPVAGEPPAEGEPVAGEPPAEGKPVAGEPPAEGEPVAGEPPAEGKPVAGEPPAEGEPVAGEPPAEGEPSEPADGEPVVSKNTENTESKTAEVVEEEKESKNLETDTSEDGVTKSEPTQGENTINADDDKTVEAKKKVKTSEGVQMMEADTKSEEATNEKRIDENTSAQIKEDNSNDSSRANDDDLKDENDSKTTMIEWEDPDDYLFYLEDILKKIHKAFFDLHEEHKQQAKSENIERKVPDLKNIIPYVRRKILKGVNILFSGVIPTNMPAEKHRAYQAAVAMGATVHCSLVPRSGANDPRATTHVVATKPGTEKVSAAKRLKRVHIVTVDWLWCCAYRWDWVSEGLFPLLASDTRNSALFELGCYSPVPGKLSSKRKKPCDDSTDCDAASGENPVDKRQRKNDEALSTATEFEVGLLDPSSSNVTGGALSRCTGELRRSIADMNPMSALSIADFDNDEIRELLDDDSSSSASEEDEEENKDQTPDDASLRRKVLSDDPDSDSDSESESLSGEFPRGWDARKNQRKTKCEFIDNSKRDNENDDDEEERVDDDDESDDNQDYAVRRNLIKLPSLGNDGSSSSGESDASGESIGSVDEEMAAAVERELLNL